MGGSGRDIRSISGIDRVSINVYRLRLGGWGWGQGEMDEMANAKRDIVMDRDRRLTGWLRGQTDKVEAPVGFEVNNPWKVSAPFWLCGGVGSGECMLTIGWGFLHSWREGISEQAVFFICCYLKEDDYIQTQQMQQSNQALSSHLVSRMPSFSLSERSMSK